MNVDVPPEIKLIDKPQLLDLARRGRALHLSLGRRADWIQEHIDDRGTVVLRAFLPESSPVPSYRVLVLARRTNNTLEHFPIDVVRDEFTALPSADPAQLLRLTRWALDQIDISPLPAEYMAEWERHSAGSPEPPSAPPSPQAGSGAWPSLG